MRNSCKFVYFAQEKAKSENVPFIMPKKENLTRWDSTFFMIESVVTQLGFLSLHNKKSRIQIFRPLLVIDMVIHSLNYTKPCPCFVMLPLRDKELIDLLDL